MIFYINPPIPYYSLFSLLIFKCDSLLYKINNNIIIIDKLRGAKFFKKICPYGSCIEYFVRLVSPWANFRVKTVYFFEKGKP